MPRQPTPVTTGKAERQPVARLEFTEYELQVLQTITQNAIDQGIRAEWLDCIAGVQRKVQSGRSDLAIARRRLAVQQSNARTREHDDGTQED